MRQKSPWIAVTDKSARGGDSVINVKTDSNKFVFSAHLFPIQGNTGPVGFALVKKEIKDSEINQNFSFKVSSKEDFTLSVAFIKTSGEKYQCDLKVQAGDNIFELKPSDFILSKWGKSYIKEMESFKNSAYFEHGVLFSRQNINEYREFKVQWELSFEH